MTLAKVEPEEFIRNAIEAEHQANALIAQYSGWAVAIMQVVEAKELYALIDGKKYLEFEAWQLIGSFDHCFVDTSDVEAIIEEEVMITGYKCHAKLLRDGVQVGGATQQCGLDAYPCRGKTGSGKDNAAISAAQTWAGSKALKMRYSAVAVLGGYSAATGDEMRRAGEEQDKTQHWCSKHETNWFKKGKMRNFAHIIEGSSEWCNEPVVVPPALEGEKATPSGGEKRTPKAGSLISSAEANELMRYADSNGVARTVVMEYIMAQFNINTPLKLTSDQLGATRLFIDKQAGGDEPGPGLEAITDPSGPAKGTVARN